MKQNPELAYRSLFIITNHPIPKTVNINKTGIQSGEVIHHHDQSITPVNLRVKKITNKTISRLAFKIVISEGWAFISFKSYTVNITSFTPIPSL